MKECFIVVCQSSCEGTGVQACRTEKDARKFISGKVETAKVNLINSGYRPYITFWDAGRHVNLSAVNEDVWYNWNIFPSAIYGEDGDTQGKDKRRKDNREMEEKRLEGEPAAPLERVKRALFFSDYTDVLAALNEIQDPDEKDAAVLEIWQAFADVPMDPETEEMEEPFLYFPARTHRETIWRWFDNNYSKGVYALLYGD